MQLVISLSQQLEHFKEYVQKLKQLVGVRYGVSQKSSDFWNTMSLHLSVVMKHYDGFIADFIEDFMKSFKIE